MTSEPTGSGTGWTGGVARVLAATAAFAAVHTLLAATAAKRRARHAAGARAYDAWYRPFYNAQAVVTFGALVAYARRQPSPTLYEVRGAPAALMRAGQLAALGYAAWAVGEVGLPTFAGAPGIAAWARGDAAIPPAPEAQGPPLEPDGRVRAAGPFAHTRHPLNFAFGAILWLQPRVTATFAAFTALSTAYLVAGSWHEEARLRRRVGAPYEAYRRSGPAFFAPGTGQAAGPALAAPHAAG